jgi:3',5'-cyclic AMP phosphodiesterase CpdA
MKLKLIHETKLNFSPGIGRSAPRTLWHRAGWLFAAALLASASAASGGDVSFRQKRTLLQEPVRFAVISDTHLDDKRLGVSGQAFEDYLNQDPKLLRESEAILDAALGSIIQQRVNFVIIPGDLTKDGELRNHVLMTRYLAKLEQRGIEVFVVPGNHDINNPDAVTYVGDTNRPTPGVSPQMFRALYQRFGYGQAVLRDTHSLSYVAEPVRGLWLLGIDSCKYEENKELGYPVVSGRISPETMVWIQGVMQQAHAGGKRVIAFMHHGVNQHFFGEAELFPDYLVDDWPGVSLQLAQTGLKVVFTGHYHSQDAAYLVDENLTQLSPLCDVETGSLIQYPCAFRIVTVGADDALHIVSQRVTDIEADTGGIPFQDYAYNFQATRLPDIIIARLMAQFQLPEEQAAQVAPLVVDALIANFAGDEEPSPEILAVIGGLVASPEPMHTLGLMLGGIWTDLPPGDNELTLPFTAN